jgi:hypothetical protein
MSRKKEILQNSINNREKECAKAVGSFVATARKTFADNPITFAHVGAHFSRYNFDLALFSGKYKSSDVYVGNGEVSGDALPGYLKCGLDCQKNAEYKACKQIVRDFRKYAKDNNFLDQIDIDDRCYLHNSAYIKPKTSIFGNLFN